MRDVITLGETEMDEQAVMDIVRDHLSRMRFSIESYDRSRVEIRAKRNDPTMLLAGLYRNVSVKVLRDPSSRETMLRMRWGGALIATAVTFGEFTLIALFLLHGRGVEGTLMSILIGLAMALLNNIQYEWMKRRFSSHVKKDAPPGNGGIAQN